MKRLFFLLLIGFLGTTTLVAQTTQPRIRSFSNQGIVYNKELAFDFRINTFRGFSFAVNVGKIISYDKTRFYHFEFGNLRHPKEFKQNDQFSRRFGGQRSFFFGKQNSMFALRGGWGTKRYLSEKASTKGVAVGISYEIGPSIGILKPYYLELITAIDSPPIERKYSPEIQDIFLDVNRVQGAAPFGRGITELSFLPGAQAKFSFHFDWGAFDEYVKAIDVGIMGDFYLQKADILVDDGLEGVQNRQFFINLFVSLQLGKRS
ncbi:MAG: hypothetical protein AAGJ18_27370 [Bacteroidota bacterium]